MDYLLQGETVTQTYLMAIQDNLGFTHLKTFLINLVGASDGSREFITGTDSADTLHLDFPASSGGGIIRGRGGDDIIDGNVDGCKIYGEDGNDTLNINVSNTTEGRTTIIRGGNGNDTMTISATTSPSLSNPSKDYLFIYGDDGDDIFYLNNAKDFQNYWGGEGTDRYVVSINTSPGIKIYDFDVSKPVSQGGDFLRINNTGMTSEQIYNVDYVDSASGSLLVTVLGVPIIELVVVASWQFFGHSSGGPSDQLY